MSQSLEETNYELLSQNPQNWLQQAKWLKISAEAILKEFNEATHCRNLPERREKKLAFFQSLLMLMGLSFENLIKGVHIAQTPALSAEERLKDWKKNHRGGHGIVSLAKVVTHLNAEEENLLKRLEIYSVWAGRYTTPTNLERYIETLKPENLHNFSPADEQLWNELFARLSETLQTEMGKQNTKRY